MKLKQALTFCLLALLSFGCKTSKNELVSKSVTLTINNTEDVLWTYKSGNSEQAIAPPFFEIDGKKVAGIFSTYSIVADTLAISQVVEYSVSGNLKENPGVAMILVIRMSDKNPFVRFRYAFHSDSGARLTKTEGADRISYFKTPLKGYTDFKEITLSTFNVLTHAYQIDEKPVSTKEFENQASLMGPIFVASGGKNTMVLTYEHGSQLPDRFIEYSLKTNGEVELVAVKGNYYNGQQLNLNNGYQSLWMNIAVVDGNLEQAARFHRDHLLRHVSENLENRKPYIFYNTWNYQERNFNWHKKPYLHEMNLKRMLSEIDEANKMGIEVFVIDAGWFGKTGDWIASLERFPDDLAQVKQKLDGYGMQLGLWFNSDAAVTSEMLKRNTKNIMSLNGETGKPHNVWETEPSYNMCLVSPFNDDYANELIRVAQKYGVKYFKWDAFRQYGCNSPHHWHGNEDNTTEERGQNYSFQLPFAMCRVADKICKEIPGAIVDFDITEGQRAVGLGFLASGKYFAVNNGPYYWSLDDPQYTPGGGMGANVLVFPGLARAINARSVLDYDKWIPSTLFLAHFLPDDPEFSQWVNIGSLILGQNGIWGDLPKVSNEGKARFGEALSKYKQVREDITNSYPVRTGDIGGNPEIHEKIDPNTGKGVVVVFNNYENVWNKGAKNEFPGSFDYVTNSKVDKSIWHNGDVGVRFDDKGRAIITANFNGPGAKIVLFGVK